MLIFLSSSTKPPPIKISDTEITDTIIAAAMDALTALQAVARGGKGGAQVVISWNGLEAIYRAAPLPEDTRGIHATPLRK